MPQLIADLVVVAFSSPILIGIYQDGQLTETIRSEEKTSDALPKIFESLLERFDIQHICYARGPGSYLSIKLLYVFLKSLQITQNIKLLATDGFYFTQGAPIKAVGNRFFVKEGDTITLQPLDSDTSPELSFALPESLHLNHFSDHLEPLYILPAV